VIAPSAGGFLLQNLGAWAPGVASATLMVWAIWFTYRRIIQIKAQVVPPVSEVSNG
jgi:hypothetical protein